MRRCQQALTYNYWKCRRLNNGKHEKQRKIGGFSIGSINYVIMAFMLLIGEVNSYRSQDYWSSATSSAPASGYESMCNSTRMFSSKSTNIIPRRPTDDANSIPWHVDQCKLNLFIRLSSPPLTKLLVQIESSLITCFALYVKHPPHELQALIL